MSLEPVAWEDYPSTATPLTAATLNAQQAYMQAQADAAAASAAAAAAVGDTNDTINAALLSDPESLTYLAVEGVAQASNVGAAAAAWLPQRPSYSPIEDKLDDWWANLGGTGLTQAVVVGDSILEGTGTTDASLRAVNILQSHLRYRTGRNGGAVWPFIPADPITSASGFPVTHAGTITPTGGYGLGWRTAIIDVGGSLTFTFTGTSCKIQYLKASSTGVMSISVDGGAATVIDTNSITNPPGANSEIWSSGALGAGDHTVVITRDATSAAGQHPYIQGLLTYDGDETAGVRVLDASHHGIATSYLTSGRVTQLASAIASAGGASLVILAVGTNDYGASTDPATYKTAIEDFITGLRAGGFAGSFALVNMYSNVTRDEGVYAVYGEKMREIAVADAKVAYFDLRLRMPDVPDPVAAVEGLGLYADALHPSDAGNAWLGHVFSDYLALRAPQSVLYTPDAGYPTATTATGTEVVHSRVTVPARPYARNLTIMGSLVLNPSVDNIVDALLYVGSTNIDRTRISQTAATSTPHRLHGQVTLAAGASAVVETRFYRASGTATITPSTGVWSQLTVQSQPV